jgi:hypothetical protein
MISNKGSAAGEALASIIAALVIIVMWVVGVLMTYDRGYKTGQIDCINGTPKYHLVEQEDKSIEWERK